eukprot:1158809-Pelagomonas_calceolata.AAC.3
MAETLYLTKRWVFISFAMTFFSYKDSKPLKTTQPGTLGGPELRLDGEPRLEKCQSWGTYAGSMQKTSAFRPQIIPSEVLLSIAVALAIKRRGMEYESQPEPQIRTARVPERS